MPFKPFNLSRWFALLGLLSIAVLSIVAALMLSRFLTERMLRQEAVLTMEFIHSLVLVENTATYFHAGAAELNSTFNHVAQMPDVIRATAVQAGVLVASDDPTLAGHYYRFGENLGLAFQIQDDLLNITGDERTMGKDYLTDVIESKRTLMVVHCLTVAEPADRERLVGLLRLKHDKSLDQAAEIVELLKQYGSLDYARNMARDLITEGRTHLSAVRESPARDILASMAKYFLDREK